jgi:hypothetical protein
LRVEVLPRDWGEVARSVTEEFGECFAVLNMANAYIPGGAYIEGAAAQEENMFRRTDCHFSLSEQESDPIRDRYRPVMTELLEARCGRVYLDVHAPRICVRGPERSTDPDLGYRWLGAEEVFPFLELRAAAQDLRDGRPFDLTEARRRIAAQFDTLEEKGVQHVVFGAFGCGAFMNPADQIAALYRDEISTRANRFRVIAFAILDVGNGPDNFGPFQRVLAKL